MRISIIYFALLTAYAFCGGLMALQPVEAKAQSLDVDKSSAVIVAYHRVGEDAHPETNLRTDQFISHLEEIRSGTYTVMALPDILSALGDSKTELPPRTIAITFEAGYRSAYENAMPLLLEAGLPFTVFYASDYADADSAQHLGWRELRDLADNPLVTIGLHTAAYDRHYTKDKAEIRRQINKAISRHREEIGQEANAPLLFAYPFGEYSGDYADIVASLGMTGFGLQSGALYPGADMTALPRFPMTERYGSAERFQLVAGSLPLPVKDVEPADPLVHSEDMPVIGFTLDPALSEYKGALTCFVTGYGETRLEPVGTRRVELRITGPLPDERVRVNCTLPAQQSDNSSSDTWRWLGMMLIKQPEAPSDPALTSLQDELP